MSPGWWFVLQWMLAALGALALWCLVLIWILTGVDRWWHRRHPGPPGTR